MTSPADGRERGAVPRLRHAGRRHRLDAAGAADRLVSIILPTKNRAARLERLLPRILAQRFSGEIEIIAVDSGSRDHTVALLADAGATVLELDPEAFDYGLTRTQAAAHARGDVLVFVTSTMLPADGLWLANLVAAVDADPAVAGAYSRAIPDPGVDPLSYRDYLRADSARLNLNMEQPPDSAARYERRLAGTAVFADLTPQERRRLIQFSNVSAAIRASVFARFPFRSSDFGEDMAWAKDVLHAGFRIRYAPSSVVLYAHQYSYAETLRRFYDDGAANRACVEVTFADDAVIPTITSMVLDDWRFAHRGCNRSGDDLRDLQIHSILRRTAQIVGMWLGINEQRMAAGFAEFLDSAVPSLGRSGDSSEQRYGTVFSRAYHEARASAPQGLDAGAIEEEIRRQWGVRPAASGGDLERIHEALTIIARHAGRAAAGLSDATLAAVRAELSLIGNIRRGAIISEMRAPGPGRPAAANAADTFGVPGTARLVAPGDGQLGFEYGDLRALYTALDAREAEQAAAEWELDARATVMARLQHDVAVRDAMIRELQAELHGKVAERDAIIRTIQAELAAVAASSDDGGDERP
jgi:glycosyltransferase involved in cell wall biosynthesis